MSRRDRPINQLTSGVAGAGVLETRLDALPARHTQNGNREYTGPPRRNSFNSDCFPSWDVLQPHSDPMVPKR